MLNNTLSSFVPVSVDLIQRTIPIIRERAKVYKAKEKEKAILLAMENQTVRNGRKYFLFPKSRPMNREEATVYVEKKEIRWSYDPYTQWRHCDYGRREFANTLEKLCKVASSEGVVCLSSDDASALSSYLD